MRYLIKRGDGLYLYGLIPTISWSAFHAAILTPKTLKVAEAKLKDNGHTGYEVFQLALVNPQILTY